MKIRDTFTRRHRTVEPATPDPYACDVCAGTFRTVEDLADHTCVIRPPVQEDEPEMTSDTTAPGAGAHDDTDPDDHTACRACLGTGRALHCADWLRRSLDLFPSDPAALDQFVAEFYRRLVARDEGKPAGDQLAPLFPADLTTGDALNSQGHRQRDMLVNALVGLVSKYDPDHPESPEMVHLTRVLEKAGRDHSNFRRPDGSHRGASAEEYQEVRDVLVGLLHDTFGAKWMPEFDPAWLAAYRWAMNVMLRAADEFRPPGAQWQGFGRTVRAAR